MAAVNPARVYAACPALDTSKGVVDQTIKVDSAGTYTVWSRIMAPDTTNNSYILEIDGNTCGINVGDNANMPANTWTWVDYKDSTPASKITVTLTAGNHSFRLIGREAGVKLDRILLLSPSDTCITDKPSGTGDNCTVVAGNASPSVSLTAPANNSTYTAPASITIKADAADSDGTVSKVEFFQGATKLGEALTSPYSFTWSNVPAGTYNLTARATDNGTAFTNSAPVSITVNSPQTKASCTNAAPCSIWAANETPVTADTPDGEAVELGLKFRSDTDGSITGVRFYKSAANTGTHVGSLWSSNGVRLANATFSNESASGWQQVSFPTPVGIIANTTYIVSYNAPVGRYAGDNGYFASGGRDNAPLHALADGVDGPNSVYTYGPAGSFPNNTYQSSNYWVDVMFSGTATPPPDTTAPSVSITAPLNDDTLSNTVDVRADATDNVGVAGVQFKLDGVNLGAEDTVAPYSVAWDTKTASNTTHSLTAVARDAAGNTASNAISVAVRNGDTSPPTAPTRLSATPAAYNAVDLTWTASNDNVGVTGYYIIRNGVTVAQVGTITSYNDATVSASTAYNYIVKAFDAAGNVSANSNQVTVTTPAAPDTQAPSTPDTPIASTPNANQINLTWTASTDNIGVTSYDVYRAANSGTPLKIATVGTNSFGDSGLAASSTYSYYVIARDAAGNTSTPSATVTATTPTPPPATNGSISGVVSNTKRRRISGVKVTLTAHGENHTYTTARDGSYTVPDLEGGTYSVTYRRRRYIPQTISVKVTGGTATKQNVTLRSK